jgi:glycosyltransferase involved in cell wall biosynthesis
LEALDLFIKENTNPLDFEIVTFGKSNDTVFENAAFKVHHLGVLSETKKIAEAYSLSDLFVLPSLEDNLPNTIMESFACGTPVLAFNTGGIPEMVEHKNTGYLADYKSVEDLKNGLEFILNHPKPEELSKNALKKVKNEYNEQIVAKKYKEVYASLLNSNL